MNEEEVRKVIREELQLAQKMDKTIGIFYAFAIWLGIITVASFLFEIWSARQTISQNTVDVAATLTVFAAIVMVTFALWFYAKSDGKTKKQ